MYKDIIKKAVNYSSLFIRASWQRTLEKWFILVIGVRA